MFSVDYDVPFHDDCCTVLVGIHGGNRQRGRKDFGSKEPRTEIPDGVMVDSNHSHHCETACQHDFLSSLISSAQWTHSCLVVDACEENLTLLTFGSALLWTFLELNPGNSPV